MKISISWSSTTASLRHPAQHKMDTPILLHFLIDQSKPLFLQVGQGRMVSIALRELLDQALLVDLPDTVPIRHAFIGVAVFREPYLISWMARGDDYLNTTPTSTPIANLGCTFNDCITEVCQCSFSDTLSRPSASGCD